MRKSFLGAGCGLLSLGMGLGAASGQSLPTAVQRLEITAFGAGTGTYTGLDEGRNLGITAGIDLSFRTTYGLRPTIEVRGSYAIDEGEVDGQKSVMVGPRVAKSFGRVTPYLDLFYGRGAIDYPNGGFILNNFRYDRTTSNVFAVGGGLDYRVTRHFDVKADIQLERWLTPVISTVAIPVVVTGSVPSIPGTPIYPVPISVGVVYHLDFNRYGHGGRRDRKRSKKEAAQALAAAGAAAPPVSASPAPVQPAPGP